MRWIFPVISAPTNFDMTIKRALVTGLHGLTGKYVAAELSKAGFIVYGIGLASRSDTHYYQVDLLDSNRISEVIAKIRPHIVIHLAAISDVRHKVVKDIYDTNVVGTRNLLKALADNASNLTSVLLASSASVYGNSGSGVISEDTPFNPMNDYAVSKVAMEYMARLWLDPLPIIITRPFNYTGLGQSLQYLLPKIVDHFIRGEKIIELGNIDIERDFSDVRMVASVYRRLIELKPIGGIFNICSEFTYSLREVLSLMAEIAGYDIEVRVNPALVRTNDAVKLRGSSKRLKAALGSNHAIPLKDTLRWMYESNSNCQSKIFPDSTEGLNFQVKLL